MLEGIFNIEVIEEGFIVKTARLHNTVLDSGLKALIGSAGGADFINYRDRIVIGSSDRDISYDQSGLIVPFFEKDGQIQVLDSNEPGREYVLFSVFLDIARTEATGTWAEIGLGNMTSTINRCLFSEPGSLSSGAYRYAVTSVNNTGESPLSDPIDVIAAQDGSIRISWQNPSGTNEVGRNPEYYNIYREVSGTFLRIKSVARDDNKLYFYDRGEDIPLGAASGTSAFLRKPIGVSGTYISGSTPKPFIKTELQEVKIRVDFYMGNDNQTHYRKEQRNLPAMLSVEP